MYDDHQQTLCTLSRIYHHRHNHTLYLDDAKINIERGMKDDTIKQLMTKGHWCQIFGYLEKYSFPSFIYTLHIYEIPIPLSNLFLYRLY